MQRLITLLTDFGTQDGYVGAMKGVILSEHPDARVVDITHDVAPQDVLGGAFALTQAAPRFPPGTIHVAVVDPGVGSDRRAIAIACRDQIFIGPDNGLLAMAAPGDAWVLGRLPPDWHVHPTFHGRDVFARVAGRIAAGGRIEEFSTEMVAPRRLELPATDETHGERIGQVIHVDRFGNLITNLVPREEDDPSTTVADIFGSIASWHHTYSDVGSGRLVAYVGSAGFIEVALRDGSAAELLGVSRGTRVRLHHKP